MIDENVRLPRKLAKSVSNGAFEEVGLLHPVGAVGITLNMLPLHRVTFTLMENDTPLSMHDLVEVYNHNGSVGIYRVTRITNLLRKDRQYELAHGLDVFSDATFTSIEKFTGTVATFLQKIVNAQTQKIGGVAYWQLGTVQDTNPWIVDIKYDNLMECLTDIAKKEEDYVFTFDQSTFPWTLNFVARDNTVLSEFRLNRNVESCSYSLDDSELCTRLHLSVTTETEVTVVDSGGTSHSAGKKTSEGYYTYNDTAAQADFGPVVKTAGVLRNEVPTDSALNAWVAAYFSRHNTPVLQISISGEELNKLTGEDIDEMHISRICRVSLPDYSTVFNERIVSINYPDALRTPRYIKASLANKRQTAEGSFSEIKQSSRRGGGAGKAASQKANNNETDLNKQKIVYDLRVEKDDRHWAVIASEEWFNTMESGQQTLVGKYDGKFEVTARHLTSAFSVSGVQLDANGDPVTDGNGNYVFNGSNNCLSSQITQNATNITTLVTKTGVNSLGQNETLYSKVTQNAGDITTLVSKTGVNSLGQNETIYSKITQTASTINATITADEQILTQVKADVDGITLSGNTITIKGNSINLTGVVYADDLNAVDAKIDNLTSGTTTATHLKATTLQATSIFNLGGSQFKSTPIKIGSIISATVLSTSNAAIDFDHYHGISITESNGVITITQGAAQLSAGSDSFNIAATQFYQDAVAAAEASGYNNGRPISGTAGGRTSGVTALVHDFTITKGDGTTVTLNIDCTSIYTAARTGYTLGTFTQATVTPQGASDAVFVEMASGGYDYYKAAAAQNYYPGNGGSFTVQGESAGTIYKRKTSGSLRLSRYSSQSTRLYYKGSDDDYYSAGDHIWWYQSSSGTYYYLGDGSDSTLYNAGTVTKHDRGTAVSVTPIDASTKKHLVATTRYKAGTADSTTYYTKS